MRELEPPEPFKSELSPSNRSICELMIKRLSSSGNRSMRRAGIVSLPAVSIKARVLVQGGCYL